MKLQIHPNSLPSKKYLYAAASAKNSTSKPIQINMASMTKIKIRKGGSQPKSVGKGSNEGNVTGLALGN